MSEAASRAATLDSANIALHLPRMAAAQPFVPAIHAPSGRDGRGRTRYVHWTYRQLEEESERLAKGLADVGIGKGVRTALMVPPSLDLFALVFALFKVGAPLVMVDPGMGVRHLGDCLDRAEPEAFVGIPKAHAARAALGWGRRTVRTVVNVAPRWARPLAFRAKGAFGIDEVRERGEKVRGSAVASVTPEDLAAILFTSGSTGPPKGALYQHGTFAAQVESIRAQYDIRPGEIDLPTFPLFSLFDPALGMVTVLPEMDSTRPADVDPRNVIEAIESFGVTNMFGSPALLDTVARWAVPRGVTLPTLRRVISAGAPVAPRILEAFAKLLPDGARIHTPYGATESLPVATIAHDEVLGETRARTDAGEGICVGRPFAIADVSIVRITDAPIASWEDAERLPPGEIGEIVVRGPQVTRGYVSAPEHTAAAKIPVPEGVAHRMGDVGYVDARGRLWFCGRKSHRVTLEDGRTLFTIPCEGPFTAHPDIKRAALVGAQVAGRSVPVMCLEPWVMGDGAAKAKLVETARGIAAQHEHTRELTHFLVRERFPVDVRHNAKIRREELAVWASEQLRKGAS